MLTTTLRSVGGSVMFAIPKAILDSLHLRADSTVSVSVADGKLVVDPSPRLRFTLAELLRACDANMPLPDEDAAWSSGGAVGSEAV